MLLEQKAFEFYLNTLVISVASQDFVDTDGVEKWFTKKIGDWSNLPKAVNLHRPQKGRFLRLERFTCWFSTHLHFTMLTISPINFLKLAYVPFKAMVKLKNLGILRYDFLNQRGGHHAFWDRIAWLTAAEPENDLNSEHQFSWITYVTRFLKTQQA